MDIETLKDAPIIAYLRKSRFDDSGDVAETLSRHRIQLEEYAKRNGLSNVTFFQEVGSGESLHTRPVFRSILRKIEDGEVSGLLVVAIDRISRAKASESGYIFEAIADSNCLIVTPSRTYNLNDSNDLRMQELNSFFARDEMRTMRTRLQAGKLNSTKLGRYVSGQPPFPYEWDRNLRKAVPNPEKVETYNYIVNRYIAGHSVIGIAKELNAKGIKTARGGLWRQSTLTNILESDFPSGIITYGQTYAKNSGERVKQNDTSKILRVVGNHTPVITKEKHAKVLQRLKDMRAIPTASRRGRFRLSGVIYCGYCKKSIAFHSRKSPKVEELRYLRACRGLNMDGTQCVQNNGSTEDMILFAVYSEMLRYRNELFSINENVTEDADLIGMNPVELQEHIIKEAEARLERLRELYIMGDISKVQYEERKRKEDDAIQEAGENIIVLNSNVTTTAGNVLKERKALWESVDLQELFFETPPQEANRIIKKLVRHIYYKREKYGEYVELHFDYV